VCVSQEILLRFRNSLLILLGVCPQILAYPNGGMLSLLSVSLGIGLSTGLSTVLLAMALASEIKGAPEELELNDDYRGSSRGWGGLSQRTGVSAMGGTSGSSLVGKDNVFVTALQTGQATGAVVVVCVWMGVKAAGQGNYQYVEERTTVLNGGRVEMMLAAAGCIVGAYVCTRVCAGRYDKTSLTETDPLAQAALVQIVRPFALALMLNSICSTVLFPRLLDSAPSSYGMRPDWLASNLTLLYCVADLAGRIYSQDFFSLCLGLIFNLALSIVLAHSP